MSVTVTQTTVTQTTVTPTTVTPPPEMEGGDGDGDVGAGAGGAARKPRKKVYTKHVGWLPAEDQFLAAWHRDHGESWAKCARALAEQCQQPRTGNSLRNRHRRLVVRMHKELHKDAPDAAGVPFDAAAYADAAAALLTRGVTTKAYRRLATWSDRERELLEALTHQFGDQWAQIASRLPGRDIKAVKMQSLRMRHKRAAAAAAAANGDDDDAADDTEGEEEQEQEE